MAPRWSQEGAKRAQEASESARAHRQVHASARRASKFARAYRQVQASARRASHLPALEIFCVRASEREVLKDIFLDRYLFIQ